MAVHVLISGLVQGVGYRMWLQRSAQAHGLGGWTRNLSDGRVEAVLTGPDEQIRLVIDLARKGPPGAKVSAVQERPADAGDKELAGDDFRILPTP